jgi:hypothetical protein
MKPLQNERGHSSVYQSGNRYAYLLWLHDQGIEAWLVHLLVLGDPHVWLDDPRAMGARTTKR